VIWVIDGLALGVSSRPHYTERERNGDQTRKDPAARPPYRDAGRSPGLYARRHGQRHRENGFCRRAARPRRQWQLRRKGRHAGTDPADIVKTNTFVTDYEEFSKHGDMRRRYFGPATPTSTTVQISRLADPDAMIEIEAVAVIDS